MFKVFAFGFETRNKTISSLISTHGHTSLVSDKHVPAFQFQSMFAGAGAVVWFSCSQM